MADFRYRAFGLVLASQIPLPSLDGAIVETGEPVDVWIRLGPVAMPSGGYEVDEMMIAVQGDRVWLRIPECGRFEVCCGRAIIIQPEAGASAAEVQLYLLGSVIGTLLYQRGLLPMHCNAVVARGRAFLFAGDSGAGKSTLAAYFQRRGYRLLTDDVCALSFDEQGRVMARSGIGRLKLWQESLDLLGRSSKDLPLVPWSEDKFEVSLANFGDSSLYPVASILHLREAEEGRPAGIHRLHGLDAINSVTSSIYRRRIADLIGLGPEYLAKSIALIRSIPVWTVNRRWGLELFEAEAAAAESHIQMILDE